MIVIAAACARDSSEKLDTTRLTEQTHATPTNTLNSRAPLTGETASTSLRSANPNSSDSSALTCTPVGPTTVQETTLRRFPRILPNHEPEELAPSDLASVFPGRILPRTHGTELRLPAEIQAIPFVYGRDTIGEPVFSEPGRYLLEVGDNFATDFGTPAPSCSLTFVRKLPK